MKLIQYCIIFLFLFSCTNKFKIGDDEKFITNYDTVYYADINLNQNEYFLISDDFYIDLNKLSNFIKLSRKESNELTSILIDSTCFEKEGECGTYYDNACFIFKRKRKIIKIITFGCSYSYFSNCPNNLPCSNGSIKNPCDKTRYNKLLNNIWSRIKK